MTGYLLAEGRASERLVRLFRALFGWIPGGLPIVTTLVCAFFTTFTGASGVTILALGGLLLPILLKDNYPERFSIGLLTASGSIGLLFPPSLAVILYGVITHVPIPDLFKAGIVPGMLMVTAVCLFGVRTGLQTRTPRPAFDFPEAVAAVWGVSCGVYALGEEAVAALPERGDHETTTFPALAERGRLRAFRHDGIWMTINTPKDLRIAEEHLQAFPGWLDSRYGAGL